MKKITTLAIAAIVAGFGPSSAMASDHHKDAIKEHIKEHFQLVAEGKFEKAYENFHPEAVVFGADGGLLEKAPSGEAKKQAIKKRKKEHEKGKRINLTPKHIKVMVDEEGNSAFATHYLEGEVTEKDGKDHDVRERATAVFTKEDGDWKIIHTHVSPIKSAGEYD